MTATDVIAVTVTRNSDGTIDMITSRCLYQKKHGKYDSILPPYSIRSDRCLLIVDR